MKIEIRNDHILIEGYVNAVGRDSRLLTSERGAFLEQVTPGTFQKALSTSKSIELRFNHEKVIGSTGTGDLQLFEDNIGLYAKAVVTDPETIEKARNHELRGWSFGFRKLVDEWEETTPPRRKLHEIDLTEVSIVGGRKTPAYAGTSIEIRGEEDFLTEYRHTPEEPEFQIVYTPDYSYRRRLIELKKEKRK